MYSENILSFFSILVVVIIVVVVIVVATKKSKSRRSLSPGDQQGPGNNPLYVPPQDVLSLIPDSEKTGTEYNVGEKGKEL